MSEDEDQPYHKKLGRELGLDGLKHVNLDDIDQTKPEFNLNPNFKGKRKNEEE